MKQANQLIEWDSKLETGIFVIDQEHRFLIENINLLHQISTHPQEDAAALENELTAVFDNLVHYSRTHFVVEEELMRVWSYEGLHSHKLEHDRFLQRILSLQQDMQEQEVQLGQALLNFLKEWLTQHILVVDQAMAHYLKAKGQN